MNTQIEDKSLEPRSLESRSLEPSGELATAIHNFRSAVEHVAARETARPVPAGWLVPAEKRHRRAQQTMVLAWVCAVLLCLAMLPLSMNSHQPADHPVAGPAAIQAPESDSALLEQVDTNVSQSVPSPLAPLAELENWDASTNTSSDASGNGTALTQTERTNVTH
jgi:hypothetical protein